MENNYSITIASIKADKERKLLIGMDENLEPQPGCCIYKVPIDLRKINEDAYTPQVISIGPIHHGKKELADMERQKIRYQREFSKRITMEKWQLLITFIENHEKFICDCYAEMPKFERKEFVTMILYDAVFIIELFLRDYFKDNTDFLLNKPRVRVPIRLDLELLENQLPYFVIKELYKLAFPNHFSDGEYYPSFFLLCSNFLNDYMLNGIPEEAEVKHFTDWRRHGLTKIYPEPQSTGWFIDLPGSVKLNESGVKFKFIEGECLLDVKFEKKKRRIPWFAAHELQIPRFPVYDDTESLIRNVMAFEQCHYPMETHVCNYIHLMDFLINTQEDVNLLTEAGIIANYVGESSRIAQMFNQLCLQINVSNSCYSDIVDNLKAHYDNPCNHVLATLKRVYFSNLWRSTGTVAAIVLLVLTLIQTICSIMQVEWF